MASAQLVAAWAGSDGDGGLIERLGVGTGVGREDGTGTAGDGETLSRTADRATEQRRSADMEMLNIEVNLFI